MPIILGGQDLSPLVEIGLTDLPRSGCAMAHPAQPETTGLLLNVKLELRNKGSPGPPTSFETYLYSKGEHNGAKDPTYVSTVNDDCQQIHIWFQA